MPRVTLYFEIIQAIDEGLTKPSKVEDIPKYLEELEKRAKVEKGDSSISEPEKEEIKKEEPKKSLKKKKLSIKIKKKDKKEQIQEPKKESKKEEPKKEESKKEEALPILA